MGKKIKTYVIDGEVYANVDDLVMAILDEPPEITKFQICRKIVNVMFVTARAYRLNEVREFKTSKNRWWNFLCP